MASMKAPDDLLPTLDAQIELLQRRLALMQAIADCVSRADMDGLEEQLRQEEGLQADGAALDARLTELRVALAQAAGMPTEEMTLGRLAELLEGAPAIALADRRERLLLLLESVRAESQRTALLVRHALAFSERMMAALLGVAGEGRVYSADGTVHDATNKTIVRHCV